METETRSFYERASNKVSDVSTRKLLGDLAEAERKHVTLAENLQHEYVTREVEAQEEKAHRRLFVLQIVQPGLAGLMDGSVQPLLRFVAASSRPTAATAPSRSGSPPASEREFLWRSRKQLPMTAA